MNFRGRKRKEDEQQTGVRPVVLQQARKTGVLNLANRSLKQVPDTVWNLNSVPKDASATFDSTDNWWDQVELNKLILSSNQLNDLSEDIKNFKALRTLDVHDNELSMLPQSLSELTLLEKLDVSHNKLQDLPCLDDCENILSILLQHNNLAKLPAFIANLRKCERLDVSHNQLTEVAFPIDTNFKYLNVSHNQVQVIDLTNFRYLRFLDLTSNQLTSFPKGIECLTQLEQAYLRNNALCTFSNLEKCTSLKELYLGNNKLTTVPENLPTSIAILELRDNKISAVPDSITTVKGLERLDLGNNNISILPPEMGNMSTLKVVVLDGNPMRSIRRDIISRGTQAVLAYLRSRIVVSDKVESHGGEQSIPQSPFHRDLSRKSEVHNSGKLHAMKQEAEEMIGNLDDFSDSGLNDVSLTHSGMSEFPAGLHQFKGTLSGLNLSCNKLKVVPPELGGYTCLTHLNLSSNNLTALPGELSALKSLLELNIACNRFPEIPNCIFQLLNLENLLADDNQIANIPANDLLKLEKLSTLSLKNNCIDQVPPELALLKKLRSLVLEGNTFRIPRQSILQKGPAAVLEYLRSRLPN